VEPTSFLALLAACAPAVHPDTARALVAVESSFNPHAIGVVGGVLKRQPRTRSEALATTRDLLGNGWNFSVGLAQINVRNFQRLGLSLETAFEPCANLAAMQAVLGECYERAVQGRRASQQALRKGLSCYYSGNFSTGFRSGYVSRITAAVRAASITGAVPATSYTHPTQEAP
jgi:type IV secretion system protein VirB1